MIDIYTTCEDIPLRKFIAMYKGDLDALIRGGDVRPTDIELRSVAMRLIDEYSVITGNKNIAVDIENRSMIVDCNIKIILLESADHLIDAMMYDDAADILGKVGIRMPAKPLDQDISVVKKRIQSKIAQVRYRLSVLERNKPKPSEAKEKDFTRERMVVSTYFKMHIDQDVITAAEYGNMIRIMFNQLEDMRAYGGKRD